MSNTSIRKAAFQLLRSRPREVALQVLYQEDLNPGVDPAVGDELLQRRMNLGEFLAFGRDELLQEIDEEGIPFDAAGLAQFSRGELTAFAREFVPDFSGDDLQMMTREELAGVIRTSAVEFARKLLHGVRARRAELDAQIEQVAENWSLSRMAATDRNVLRLGVFELLYCDTPARVAIDEAVELAKRFGTSQSGTFVNGILDRVMRGPAPTAT